MRKNKFITCPLLLYITQKPLGSLLIAVKRLVLLLFPLILNSITFGCFFTFYDSKLMLRILIILMNYNT